MSASKISICDKTFTYRNTKWLFGVSKRVLDTMSVVKFEAASAPNPTAMGTTKRKSTVHDLSSLRLHPDGSRVGSSSSNVRPRSAKYVVKDLRGNWIARDAAGRGTVNQRRSRRLQSKDADEAEQDEDDDAEPRIPSEVKGKGKAVEGSNHFVEEITRKDPRAVKRKLFADDISFLSPALTSAAVTDEAFIPGAAEDVQADPSSVRLNRSL